MKSQNRIAILGGSRIPFARQNTAYADVGNTVMLTAALKGVVDRFGLQGQRIGEVAGGAVVKHSRDPNISREATLDSGLSPHARCATVLSSGGIRRVPP